MQSEGGDFSRKARRLEVGILCLLIAGGADWSNARRTPRASVAVLLEERVSKVKVATHTQEDLKVERPICDRRAISSTGWKG